MASDGEERLKGGLVELDRPALARAVQRSCL